MARILFVEDDPMIADIYVKKISGAGFEVDNAKTGKEVLKLAAQGKYDFILLDMVLPEMSGMDVLKELKKSGNYDKSTKVFIFSNLNKAEIEQEAVENGADGIMGKSDNPPSALIEKIGKILGQD